MNILKKIINEKVVLTILLVLVALQPLFDLDYLLADMLDTIGIPRVSTILRFIVIPLLVLITFIVDKRKKTTMIFGGLYGVVLTIYFVLHCINAIELFPKLYMPSNYYFDVFQELTYVLTLVLPFAIVYCFFKLELKESMVKTVTTVISLSTALPIFIGDIVPFGLSTYVGYTKGNFIQWFIQIFDESHEIPKYYTSKFFFDEGNTIGILMFMVLPLLYYYFHKESNKNKKIGYGVLILIHSLSMMILGTRVATYGAVLIPVVYLVMVVVMTIFKKEKFNWIIIVYSLVSTLIFGMVLPYSPAVKNQQIDAKNDLALASNGAAEMGKQELAGMRVSVVKESDPAYINMFEEYGIRARYAQSISKEYYLDYYDYRIDPYFWVEMILVRPLEERIGGRNIQKLFFNYKWNDGMIELPINPDNPEETQTIYFNGCNFSSPCLTTYNRAMGLGYSTFMNGSIVLEQDFIQQFYTFGSVGVVLVCGPWIVLTLACVVMLLRKFKDHFNLENGVYALSIVLGFGSGYMSGHVLDQFITSLFMAMVMAMLLRRLGTNHE